ESAIATSSADGLGEDATRTIAGGNDLRHDFRRGTPGAHRSWREIDVDPAASPAGPARSADSYPGEGADRNGRSAIAAATAYRLHEKTVRVGPGRRHVARKVRDDVPGIVAQATFSADRHDAGGGAAVAAATAYRLCLDRRRHVAAGRDLA